MRRTAPCGVLALTLLACGRIEDAPRTAPAFKPRDVLAQWEQRFARVPAGASDATLPEAAPERLRELLETFHTATASGRALARYAARARKNIVEAGIDGVLALRAFVSAEDRTDDEIRNGLAIFDQETPAALVTLCFAWLEYEREALRIEAARILGASGSIHALPKLVRRLRYELEQPPTMTIAVARAVAELGNPAGVPKLLEYLGDARLRDAAGAALVRVLEIFGPAYRESDGWGGLERKARGVWERFRRTGRVRFADESRPELPAADYATQRELWLFLRHLGGEPLRPVDDARFVCKNLGRLAVPLLVDALEDRSGYVRVHTLEILRDVGRPGKPAEHRVQALIRDPLCRIYALEALGAVGADSAVDVLAGLLIAGQDPSKPASPDAKIAALKGLMHLAEPRALPLLLRLRESAESTELRVWAAAALMATSAAAREDARAFLQKALDEGTYHAPTLRELLDK